MNPDLQNQRPSSRLRGNPPVKAQPVISGADGKPMSAEQLFSANLLALTDLETRLVEYLSDIAESLELLALYFERKGRNEELFSEKDFAPDDETAKEAGDGIPQG